MDDAGDRTYSRAPEVKDLVELCHNLNRNGVQYLLIGGFAVILHGFVRGTKDIDLLIEPSEQNVERVKKALSALPDNTIALIENSDVAKYQVVRIADEIVVDLMAIACGLTYENAKTEIEWKEIEGVRIPVASKPLLIRLKDTIRPTDKTDVMFLSRLIQEEKS